MWRQLPFLAFYENDAQNSIVFYIAAWHSPLFRKAGRRNYDQLCAQIGPQHCAAPFAPLRHRAWCSSAIWQGCCASPPTLFSAATRLYLPAVGHLRAAVSLLARFGTSKLAT